MEDATKYVNQQVEDAQRSMEEARAHAQESLEQYQKVNPCPRSISFHTSLLLFTRMNTEEVGAHRSASAGARATRWACACVDNVFVRLTPCKHGVAALTILTTAEGRHDLSPCCGAFAGAEHFRFES